MRQISEVVMDNGQRKGDRHGWSRLAVRARRAAPAAVLLAAAAGLAGCNADSWFDQSVNGYWENTPTTMPILDRIAAIEDKTPDFVETGPPTREDLIAEAQPYRLGPSDDIEISIPNFDGIGFTAQYPRQVDARGYITLPRVGQVYILGKTDLEAGEAIARAIQAAEILNDPTVSVIIVAPRQQTYSVLGAVASPGVFLVNKPDYRLLDAIAASGGFDESTEKIFVVRQIPLSDQASGRTAPPPDRPPTNVKPATPPDPENLLDVIDELTKPTTPPTNPPTTPPGGGLGVRRTGAGGTTENRRTAYTGLQPDGQPTPPTAPKPTQPIDLIDSNSPTGTPTVQTQPDAPAVTPPSGVRSRSRWVFVNGQWTRDAVTAVPTAPGAVVDPLAGESPGKDLMTQRVIEIPVKPLLAGQSDVNIVIRPGDVVRIPAAPNGVIYLGGQVARPGTFTLPPTGKLTLLRAIDAAGGLGQLAIPEKVELTRMVGTNREATIMLNMRAIAEKTQPDVILKADDRVNVGTNFWAFPIAVIRNGFRMSYGFGFLIDRNFGNDVFGPPPESNNNGFN